MTRGLIPAGRAGWKAMSIAALLVNAMTLAPATAAERLLRCATSPISTGPGHHPQTFAQHRFYAPVSSAMFFSHAGSACRWKTGQHRRG